MQMVIDVEAELMPSHTGLLGVFHSSPEGAHTTTGESCIQKSAHDASASTLSSLHRQSHGQMCVELRSHGPSPSAGYANTSSFASARHQTTFLIAVSTY